MKKSTTDHRREKSDVQRPSHLFLLRFWKEAKNDSPGSEDLAGRVQDPVSGQVQYFSGGVELMQILHRTLAQEDGGRADKAESGQT